MKSTAICLLCLLVSVNLLCQSKVNNKDLELIPGKINTYYTKTYHDKAAYLMLLIEDAVNYYEDLLKDTFNFDLYVLDKKSWRQLTDGVYPIPHYMNDKQMMIMSVNSYYKIQLNTDYSVYGKDYYYLSDFIAIHELGHCITHQLNAKSHSKWSAEFFADFTLIAYLHEIIPDYEFDNTTASYFRFLPLKYKRLENYNSAGILNELAYHPKFLQLADQIYLKHGLNFMFNWLNMYIQLNKDIEDGKYDNITYTKEQIFKESVKDMQSIEPEIFNEWNQSMRQSYHSWLILFIILILIGIIRFFDCSYSIFINHKLKTKKNNRIFGIPSNRIWNNLKNITTKSIRYKLIRISVLRIINYILIIVLIFLTALLLS